MPLENVLRVVLLGARTELRFDVRQVNILHEICDRYRRFRLQLIVVYRREVLLGEHPNAFLGRVFLASTRQFDGSAGSAARDDVVIPQHPTAVVLVDLAALHIKNLTHIG